MARRLALAVTLAAVAGSATAPLPAQEEVTSGIYRGVLPVVKFDVSPPLRELAPLPPLPPPLVLREMKDDPAEIYDTLGPQDTDTLVQDWVPLAGEIPAPLVSFNGPANSFGVQPPDPVGDVGPNHYVAMSNLSYAIYSKTGTLLFGPAANNTLWSGFGGPCQNENAGDPIVLYDQLADRWLLTQFSDSSGPPFYNCIALSQTGDPLGSYYRWQVDNGNSFPDYPKYGVWPDAYYLSTRDFQGGQVGVGAFALDRAQMLVGNPNPTFIAMFVPNGATRYNIGDGLLPSDLDGTTLPPAGTPNFFIGAMDNGGPYGAPQDALTIWEFDADFVTPANSTFTLAATLPIAPYDTIYGSCSGTRQCIPQPATANLIDILSYRQRPMHRAAYRNFGSHQSIVTNQSVEAQTAPLVAGIRWWEIRSPDSAPVIFQEGTFAPGIGDGVHRWMGSIAMDEAGNIALGYSASNATSTFPSLWYTGRLSSDPPGTLPQGEDAIIDGTGSQTAGARWGDYTSLNVDPVDDCTFWYVNEWLPVSGGNWTLRIGAFRFDECGTPSFTLGVTPQSLEICAGDNALYDASVGSISGFTDPVTLSATGNPAGTTTSFVPNPVTPPGTSDFTVGNTAAVPTGSYPITVHGVSGAISRQVQVTLDVVAGAAAPPTLLTPANGATGVSLSPTLTWSAVAGADDYLVEVDDDAGFPSPEFTATVTGTSVNAAGLAGDTTYFWRVSANNVCGSSPSATFTFHTLLAFCSTGGITIPASGTSGVASPYPSTATVAGLAGNATTVQVMLDGLTHTFPSNVDMLLVGPAGQELIFFSDLGVGTDVNNVRITLDDAAASIPPTTLVSGTFRPSNTGANDAFAPPAPPSPYGNAEPAGADTLTSSYGGDNPNGTWSLFIVDDTLLDVGSLTRWCLLIPELDSMPFLDGFETGDTSRWSSTVP